MAVYAGGLVLADIGAVVPIFLSKRMKRRSGRKRHVDWRQPHRFAAHKFDCLSCLHELLGCTRSFVNDRQTTLAHQRHQILGEGIKRR